VTLDGIRIVSTATNVPGPVAAAILRDMGADVVKIEPPFGDPLSAGAPEWYAALCAGIDVRVLDLKSREGRGGLDALLEGAELLLTATRPSSLERLGLSWTSLQERFPRLCHVAIVGYPAPRRDEAGHDLTYQADAGLVAPPSMPRTLIADLSGAQRAAMAALELLLARARGGDSAQREVALSEAAGLFAEPLRHGLTRAAGWLGGGVTTYGIYPTRDGWVAVAALEPQFSAALARALSIDVDDRDAMARTLATRTAEEWAAWGREHGLPVAAIRSP
jgi:alpha-methylacyl-CoA racemase